MTQTLRQQVEEIKKRLMGAWRTEYHAAMSGSPEDEREAAEWSKKVEGESTNAILAVFKGLPALQEEDSRALHDDGYEYNYEEKAAEAQNELRRQILAELEGSHE